MQQVERDIVSFLLNTVINNGWTVTLNDGEEDVLHNSDDHDLIMKELNSTGEDYLRVYDGKDRIGTIHLVYNGDADVICNHTSNDIINDLMTAIDGYIEIMGE